MAEVRKALDCSKWIREIIDKLSKDEYFSENNEFFSKVEEIITELNILEEKIKELGFSLDVKIHWKCEIPLRLIVIINMLTRSIDKYVFPGVQYREEISKIRSEVSKLSE